MTLTRLTSRCFTHFRVITTVNEAVRENPPHIAYVVVRYLSYWLHLKKEVIHPVTVITLTKKSVAVLTSLDRKSQVCNVGDQDKTESKCI